MPFQHLCSTQPEPEALSLAALSPAPSVCVAAICLEGRESSPFIHSSLRLLAHYPPPLSLKQFSAPPSRLFTARTIGEEEEEGVRSAEDKESCVFHRHTLKHLSTSGWPRSAPLLNLGEAPNETSSPTAAAVTLQISVSAGFLRP